MIGFGIEYYALWTGLFLACILSPVLIYYFKSKKGEDKQ